MLISQCSKSFLRQKRGKFLRDKIILNRFFNFRKKDAKEKIDLVESDDDFDDEFQKILGGLTKTRDDPRIGPSYWKNGQTFG